MEERFVTVVWNAAVGRRSRRRMGLEVPRPWGSPWMLSCRASRIQRIGCSSVRLIFTVAVNEFGELNGKLRWNGETMEGNGITFWRHLCVDVVWMECVEADGFLSGPDQGSGGKVFEDRVSSPLTVGIVVRACVDAFLQGFPQFGGVRDQTAFDLMSYPFGGFFRRDVDLGHVITVRLDVYIPLAESMVESRRARYRSPYV